MVSHDIPPAAPELGRIESRLGTVYQTEEAVLLTLVLPTEIGRSRERPGIRVGGVRIP